MPFSVTLPSGATVSIPKHQAADVHRYVPKVSYLPVRSGDTSQVWKASGVFLDFLLPKNVGILKDVRLRFNVNNTTGSNYIVSPTPFWVQQIEVSVGTTPLEVLYPADIFTETVGFLSSDEAMAKNEVLAVSSAADPADGYNAPQGASVFYLPFNNCLSAARVFISGIDDDVNFRIYFPPNVFASGFTMTSVVLEILEDVPVDNMEIQKLREAHKRGMVYNTVVRQRQQTTLSKVDATSNMNIDLTGVTGKSAGLVIYANTAVVPGSGTVANPHNPATTLSANVQLARRYVINTLELNDQMGNKRTEQLQGAAQQSFVWWEQVGTQFASDVYYNTYLLPFSTNFKSAVSHGINLGSLNFDGTDRLVLTAPFAAGNSGGLAGSGTAPTGVTPPSSETWVVSITNYVYNQIVFQNNKLNTVVKR